MNASDYDECACGNAKAVRADRCIACYAAGRDREHGTRSCYAAGCRLPECREANAAYNRRRRAGRGREAVAAVRDVQVQVPAGWVR